MEGMGPEKKQSDSHSYSRMNRTGEDIDMLHEHESDPESSDRSGSYHYKDDYDGA